jgi:DNA repair protein RecN (Recombination protein N)
MLTSLRIENYAIVTALELDFASGMTAFTGETGAGKSIMIDALMLAMGERADATVIRPGALKCDITASFHIDEGSLPFRWLQEHDVEAPLGDIFLRRIIQEPNRSKSYINGQPFPLHKIKELSEMLVDIHGQHQHQTLLHHQTHRNQLDQYAGHQSLLEEVSCLYHECQKTKEALKIASARTINTTDCDLLDAQIEEILSLGIQEGEIQALNNEHSLLHHAQEYMLEANVITELLNADDGPSIRHGLSMILQRLTAIKTDHPEIKSVQEFVNNALILCDEALEEMTKFVQRIELNPERLLEVEERMSLIHHFARKYHVEAGQLSVHVGVLAETRNKIAQISVEVDRLSKQYEQQVAHYEEKALLLRASRQRAAKLLTDEISYYIRQLGMPKGYITLDITPLDSMHGHGKDRVEYRVCTNPGMAPDLLAKVASGGELSRIGLAIHVITAIRGSTPTLLFDEVDVGIGGSTAALVGKMLRQLGERLQVFCVTHQPQVASMAHHHFRVEKITSADETMSVVTALGSTDKIDEIARMLGGLTITEQTRSHAKELLELALPD